MNPPPPTPNPYRRLLLRSAAALALGLALVVVCYFFVDRPVAFFVASHKIADTPRLVWLTEPPPLVQGWSPLIAAIILGGGAWRRRGAGSGSCWSRARP